MKITITLVAFLLVISTGNAKDSTTVYIFMLEDCPVTQSYTLKLKDLHQKYGIQFPFIGIFPNRSSKKVKIDEFLQDYAIPFPVRTDYDKKLVKQFSVKRTPEVVVYNESENVIYYRGRIDNEFAGLGKRRKVVTTDELSDVLATLQEGKEKIFTFTEAVGCLINQNDQIQIKE